MRSHSFRLSLITLFLAAISLACGSTNSSKNNPSRGATTVPAGAAAPRTSPTPTVSVYPMTVKRSDGKEITIQSQPKRIVSLSAGTTEILYAIGAQGQLVATDKFSDYPEEAKSTSKLDAFRPNPEAIAGLSPDLVMVTDNQGQIVETLDGLKIPTLYLKVPGSLNELFEQIQFYGDVTGHPAGGQRLAAGLRARVDDVQRKLSSVQNGPRVYHELDPTLFSTAPNSFVGDLYTLLKAQNIVPVGSTPYPQITQEFIVAQDPEVIILADEAAGVTPESVKARPGWERISAVKNGSVHTINPAIVSRSGPRIVDGLERLAKLLYPDRFP